MAHLYGIKSEAGKTTKWHPIAAEKIGDEYVLKAIQVAAEATIEHHNGNAELAATTISFSGITKRFVIENMSGTAKITVSFDGGVNFKTIAIGKTLDVECSVSSIDIKASAATTPYEIIAIV